ncbi:MAG: ATP-dependent Clp protease proteolytic subunit [Eubacteriales bacterium]|nr:ATP-dependent Clp protease proteolytic subunit [Eubacteriales bacterium]
MNTVPYKTAAGCSWVPLESYLLSQRKVHLTGEITSQSADMFVQEMTYLALNQPEEPVEIRVDSPGGEVTAGLLIYDTLKALPMEYRIICTGTASSMAAIILAGGKKGCRFILPHSKVMIHEPLIQGGVGGSATSIRKTAESIMETKRLTAELLSADTGKSIEEVEKAISFDNYMNAQEAVDFGIADKVIESLFS